MNQNNNVAIIQARMGSSRLPGKVLMPFAGRSVLSYLINRISHSRKITSIVVATTTEDRDDLIVGESLKLGVPLFRGSERDVLERYRGAARAAKANIVVRVTADNPFTDPASIDRVIQNVEDGYDYAIETDMPVGTTGEALTIDALEFIAKIAWTDKWREHVTLFAKENPHLLKCAFLNAPSEVARPDLSFTIDKREEYDEISMIGSAMPDPHFSLKELIERADRKVVA